VKEQGEEGMKKLYEEFKAKRKAKARHGMKLNYINSLKSPCREGYEPYFFRRGGKVGCKCVKKACGGKAAKKKACGGMAFKK